MSLICCWCLCVIFSVPANPAPSCATCLCLRGCLLFPSYHPCLTVLIDFGGGAAFPLSSSLFRLSASTEGRSSLFLHHYHVRVLVSCSSYCLLSYVILFVFIDQPIQVDVLSCSTLRTNGIVSYQLLTHCWETRGHKK